MWQFHFSICGFRCLHPNTTAKGRHDMEAYPRMHTYMHTSMCACEICTCPTVHAHTHTHTPLQTHSSAIGYTQSFQNSDVCSCGDLPIVSGKQANLVFPIPPF